MKQITSTTSEGTEGFGISYSEEQEFAKHLLKILPDWKIKFCWSQILLSDVQWQAREEDKIMEIIYNQNLTYWRQATLDDIKTKLKIK